MNDVVSRSINVNGLSLHYLEWGQSASPPLILLHGGSAHAHWWDHIAPVLARTYRVLAFDLRGHGDSAWTPPSTYEITDYVSDLEGIVEHLRLQAPIVIGHSLGGFIALSYAVKHATSLRALVVVDIGPQLRQSRYIRLLRALPPSVYADEAEVYRRFRLLPAETEATPELLKHIARHSVKTDQTGHFRLKSDREAMIRQPCNLESHLDEIVCPTLLIRGQQSNTLLAKRWTKMTDACPQAVGIEISQAGHHVFLDQPNAFLDTVTNFLHETSQVSS